MPRLFASRGAMDLTLKIVIVDESPVRAAIIEEGLREAGYTDVVRISETANLLARIYAIDPDVILIDLENPSRDVLEQMFQVSRVVKRPIAMFVDQSDTASIQAVGRCRRLRLYRRRAEEGAHQAHPRHVHLALQRVLAPADRTRTDQDRARRAQGHRPRQGHPDESERASARTRPTRCCARPR